MKKLQLLAVAVVVLAAIGCAKAPGLTATAVMEPRSGSNVSGTVTFEETGEGTVRVVVDLEGVPEGPHGFHIHEIGDCSAPDGSSAGGHYNPKGTPHAGPHDLHRHAGDMGNLVAGADETVRTTLTFDSFTLSPGPVSAAGLSVIVHAKADDLASQPTGDAGGRIACGIITLANAK
jgi:superoxide dismutase, Cu-Zn family